MSTPQEPVIIVDNISKAFPLMGRQISLRHEAVSMVKRLVRGKRGAADNRFYALKDISFTVNEGESLAIVGRNGSGKSTLLRVMARIMRPTTGYTEVRGHFTALIGLGAGFIPTMTGRENIFLNAAIHGVPPDDIEARMEDIIAFADIGEFIDQPVKNYSSGMNARLGFSVAIHILPEIIFLDEVLAVGDAAFKKKCMDRIMSLRQERKTIVFVSHAESAVRRLCDRAIWLHHGEMLMDDTVPIVLKAYKAHFEA
jgi:ABC-type polysaccharide/polyol phosphate transport system ATPase subunit